MIRRAIFARRMAITLSAKNWLTEAATTDAQ